MVGVARSAACFRHPIRDGFAVRPGVVRERGRRNDHQDGRAGERPDPDRQPDRRDPSTRPGRGDASRHLENEMSAHAAPERPDPAKGAIGHWSCPRRASGSRRRRLARPGCNARPDTAACSRNNGSSARGRRLRLVSTHGSDRPRGPPSAIGWDGRNACSRCLNPSAITVAAGGVSLRRRCTDDRTFHLPARSVDPACSRPTGDAEGREFRQPHRVGVLVTRGRPAEHGRF